MNTQAHILIGAAFFAQPKRPVLNTAIVVGALLPDALIFWMFGWERFVNGHSPQKIFDELYFSDFWQGWFPVLNSIPLYVLLALVAVAINWRWLYLLGASATLHCLLDLPLHHDDGRAHFWPLSSWVYESPVSYWDPRHYGMIAGPVEAVLALIATIYLWRRFKSLWVRGALVLLMGTELLFAGVGPYLFGFGQGA